jgi:hypothetical protein
MKNKLKKVSAEEFAITVSGYTDYKDRSGEIIADVIASAPTLVNLVPQTGAKANTVVELNILSTDVTWSNADCVSTETGDNTVLAPRPVAVKRLSDRELLCLDKLDAKLPLIMRPGANNESLPFEELFINLKVAENGKMLEKAAWQGNTSTGTGNLGKVNGWLAIANAETASLAGYDTFASFTTANAIATVQTILADRTAEMFEMDNLTMYMDLPKFAILAQAVLAAYGIAGTGAYLNTGSENQAGMNEFMFPGTNVKVKGTHGLNGNGSIFLTPESNLRYVTDLEGDMETVSVYFDRYHRQLVSDLIFAVGFQYAFPEQVVYYKYSPVIS